MPFVVSRVIADALILAFALARSKPTLYVGFGKWDGFWYTQIAKSGYFLPYVDHRESPWPFFPLLPGVLRVAHWLGPSEVLVGVLVNHAAFFVALVGLFRIARQRFGPATATLALWAIALFPASFVFSMVYPSAIFFAASVWAFVLVDDGHDVAAGLVTMAAVMVRPNGLILAIAIAFAVRWVPRRVVITCAPSALAFAAWCWYNRHRTGDALTFYKAKAAWPEIDLVDFVLRDRKIAIPHVLLALAAIAAVVAVWRRLPVSWLVFTGLYLGVPLVTGMVGLGRYAGEVFPPFVAAGEILRRWPRSLVVAFFVGCVIVQAVCVYWVIYLEYLP
jgi:hypothetical protein